MPSPEGRALEDQSMTALAGNPETIAPSEQDTELAAAGRPGLGARARRWPQCAPPGRQRIAAAARRHAPFVARPCGNGPGERGHRHSRYRGTNDPAGSRFPECFHGPMAFRCWRRAKSLTIRWEPTAASDWPTWMPTKPNSARLARPPCKNSPRGPRKRAWAVAGDAVVFDAFVLYYAPLPDFLLELATTRTC